MLRAFHFVLGSYLTYPGHTMSDSQKCSQVGLEWLMGWRPVQLNKTDPGRELVERQIAASVSQRCFRRPRKESVLSVE